MSSSSSSEMNIISARLAALHNQPPSLAAGRHVDDGLSSLQSSGGELVHPPSSTKSSPTKISGGGGMGNEEKHMCVVIDDNKVSSMCGAFIGAKRFCTANREVGKRHCGLASHATSAHQALTVGDIFVSAPMNCIMREQLRSEPLLFMLMIFLKSI